MLGYEYYSGIEICDGIRQKVAKVRKVDGQCATSLQDVKALLWQTSSHAYPDGDQAETILKGPEVQRDIVIM